MKEVEERRPRLFVGTGGERLTDETIPGRKVVVHVLHRLHVAEEIEVRQELQGCPHQHRKDVGKYRADALLCHHGIRRIGIDHEEFGNPPEPQDALQRCLVGNAAVGVPLRQASKRRGDPRIVHHRSHGGVRDGCNRRCHNIRHGFVRVRLIGHRLDVRGSGVEGTQADIKLIHGVPCSYHVVTKILADISVVEGSVVKQRVNTPHPGPAVHARRRELQHQAEDPPPAYLVDVPIAEFLPLALDFLAGGTKVDRLRDAHPVERAHRSAGKNIDSPPRSFEVRKKFDECSRLESPPRSPAGENECQFSHE